MNRGVTFERLLTEPSGWCIRVKKARGLRFVVDSLSRFCDRSPWSRSDMVGTTEQQLGESDAISR